MAAIITASIDVTKIPTDKLFKGKKGEYLELTIMVNDETSEYGNNVSVSVGQSKEERDNKEPKLYLGNGKVVWTDDTIRTAKVVNNSEIESDLPF